jgi:hypothetical protein
MGSCKNTSSTRKNGHNIPSTALPGVPTKQPLNDSRKQTGKHQQGMLQPVAHQEENVRYYGGKKGCFMCNTQEEDWIHILTCPSIEANMNREESWAKARKTTKHWKLPNDFWTALEKGVHGYTRHPVGGAIDTPFPPT